LGGLLVSYVLHGHKIGWDLLILLSACIARFGDAVFNLSRSTCPPSPGRIEGGKATLWLVFRVLPLRFGSGHFCLLRRAD